jgi:predicted Zn finger-like uncharacterized protein
MKITCSTCQTKYQIPDDKVPSGGAQAYCPKCGHRILIPGGKRNGSPTDTLTSSPDADYGHTIAYDFSEVDQSRTEVTALLEKMSGQTPFLQDGLAVALRDISTGQEFPLTKATVTLGRTGADIKLSDPEVSRKHCLVKAFGDRFVVTDLGSTNGTFTQGRKIMTANLGPGDTFTVGNTTLEPVLKKSC